MSLLACSGCHRIHFELEPSSNNQVSSRCKGCGLKGPVLLLPSLPAESVSSETQNSAAAAAPKGSAG